MIATTVNLHNNTLVKITNSAVQLKKSRHEIIVILLGRIMNDHERIKHRFTSVKYQPDDSRENWHCFHIRFRQDEYEFFLDLRKLCKCSVSLLIAIAVDRYIHEIGNNSHKYVDKYLEFNIYILKKKLTDGIISWHLNWVYSKKHIKPNNIS